MSETPSTKETPAPFGWAFLGLLTLFAWIVTLVGQFVGIAWYYPWIFFTLFIFFVVKTSKIKRKVEKPIPSGVLSPNEMRAMSLREVEDYKLPHLTTIPNQYTRKPCATPEWISIPLFRNYEINCASLDVRHRVFKDLVVPGYDPEGKEEGAYLELINDNGRNMYVRHDLIVANALGKGHK